MKKKEIDSSLSNIEIENSHQRLWLIAKIYLNAWRAKAPLNSIKDFLSHFALYEIKSTLICQMFIYLLRMNGRRLGQTINHSCPFFIQMLCSFGFGIYQTIHSCWNVIKVCSSKREKEQRGNTMSIEKNGYSRVHLPVLVS